MDSRTRKREESPVSIGHGRLTTSTKCNEAEPRLFAAARSFDARRVRLADPQLVSLGFEGFSIVP